MGCPRCGGGRGSDPIGDVVVRRTPGLRGRRPTVRPDEDRWSALEYGCHVRDVLFNLRDRIVLGAVEDEPFCSPLHGTPRVERGLYEADDPFVTAGEIRAAGAIFARTWELLPNDLRQRTLIYSALTGRRTLEWVAAQALHESEHHLDDARRCIDR